MEEIAPGVKMEIDILFKEYDNRFTEIRSSALRYQKQADFLNLFLTSVLGIAALVFSDKAKGALGIFNERDIYVLYCGFFFFGPLFLFHLFASIMESLCAIRGNGERLAAIEKQINALAGKKLLIWEHQAVADFFDAKQMFVQGWIKPHLLAGIWIFLIFILLCISFCILAFKFIPFVSYLYIPLVFSLMLFHIRQWILMVTVGFDSIYSYFQPTTTAGTTVAHWHEVEWMAALLPVISVLVIAIWCAHNDALSWKSPYMFPLVYLPSIYIGDLILLPIFNFKAARWLKQYFIPCRKRALFGCFFVAFPVSVAVNIYLHYQWIHDPYSGFMDIQYAQLTPAGWCHFAFSICEMTFVVLFLLLWIVMLRRKETQAFMQGRSPWVVFILFSTTLLGDAIVKHRYVFAPRHIAGGFVISEILPLMSLLLSLAIFIALTFSTRRLKLYS